MLTNTPLVTILPAVDLNRVKKFYTEKIGLKVSKEFPGGIFFEDENGALNLYIYKRGPTKADHTVASFMVEDIEKEVMELKEKGVVFEEYDSPVTKTVNSIAAVEGGRSSWFKDTEGNILSVSSVKI
jgi:predicted enzyme related to lactoylglutathione lyase